MDRRAFLGTLAGGLLAPPLVIAAPPAGKVLRVGLLYGIKPKFDPGSNPADRALVDGLRARGYEPGHNIVFEFRTAEGHPERLPDLAAELVRLKVDVLVTSPTGPTLAAQGATRTIPIVMVGVADPVGAGIVASLARPGGNITGISVNAAEISAKRVQLLKEANTSPVASVRLRGVWSSDADSRPLLDRWPRPPPASQALPEVRRERETDAAARREPTPPRLAVVRGAELPVLVRP